MRRARGVRDAKLGRLTKLEVCALFGLKERSSHAYELYREIIERSGNQFCTRAALYAALHRLERSGLVTSALEDDDPVSLKRPLRRVFSLLPWSEGGDRGYTQQGEITS